MSVPRIRVAAQARLNRLQQPPADTHIILNIGVVNDGHILIGRPARPLVLVMTPTTLSSKITSRPVSCAKNNLTACTPRPDLLRPVDVDYGAQQLRVAVGRVQQDGVNGLAVVIGGRGMRSAKVDANMGVLRYRRQNQIPLISAYGRLLARLRRLPEPTRYQGPLLSTITFVFWDIFPIASDIS